MITIIHGDNTAQAREQFFGIKSSMKNVSSMDGPSLTYETLINFFSGTDMFSDFKNLIIENLLSKSKAGKNLNESINLLNKNEKNTEIILWEEKEISGKNLDQFPNARVFAHKFPKIIFNFLDSIAPGNGKNSIKLLHELLKNTSIEIILYMLIRQIRLLISLSSNNNLETIAEVSRMAPWQRGKLKKQAFLFGSKKLVNLYNKVFKLDMYSKTGKLSMPLTSAIDMLLADI